MVQNTEKSPGDMRRVAVNQNQKKYHQQNLVEKTRKVFNDDNNNNIIFVKPAHWPSGYCVHQWSGTPGFNPGSSHTKDTKNGTLCRLA